MCCLPFSAVYSITVHPKYGPPIQQRALEFSVVPIAYGCTGDECTTYNSCGDDRHGPLCADCPPGTGESLLSTQCSQRCTGSALWPLVVVAAFAAGVFALVASGVWFPSKQPPFGALKMIVCKCLLFAECLPGLSSERWSDVTPPLYFLLSFLPSFLPMQISSKCCKPCCCLCRRRQLQLRLCTRCWTRF